MAALVGDDTAVGRYEALLHPSKTSHEAAEGRSTVRSAVAKAQTWRWTISFHSMPRRSSSGTTAAYGASQGTSMVTIERVVRA